MASLFFVGKQKNTTSRAFEISRAPELKRPLDDEAKTYSLLNNPAHDFLLKTFGIKGNPRTTESLHTYSFKSIIIIIS